MLLQTTTLANQSILLSFTKNVYKAALKKSNTSMIPIFVIKIILHDFTLK